MKDAEMHDWKRPPKNTMDKAIYAAIKSYFCHQTTLDPSPHS